MISDPLGSVMASLHSLLLHAEMALWNLLSASDTRDMPLLKVGSVGSLAGSACSVRSSSREGLTSAIAETSMMH